jgi:hypothetical protein
MQSVSALTCKLREIELVEERLKIETLTEELKMRNEQIVRLERLLALNKDLVKDLLAENEKLAKDLHTEIEKQAKDKSADDKPHEITADGDKKWFDAERRLHRDGDKPALIRANGEKLYFKHGVVHRGNNKPARICANGAKWWYIDGTIGRTDGGPVRISADNKFSYH